MTPREPAEAADEPTPEDDPARRAAELLRAEPVSGWREVSSSIMSRVRSTVMPSEPIVVHSRDGLLVQDEHGSHDYVSARVVVSTLRTRLTTPVSSPSRIEVSTDDDHRCTQVVVEIVCSWDTDFQRAGAEAREVVTSALVELVGDDPAFEPSRDVHVHVGDVTSGDARTT